MDGHIAVSVGLRCVLPCRKAYQALHVIETRTPSASTSSVVTRFGATLIAVTELQALQAAAAPWVLLDCGFDLADTTAGERAYAAGHLPGARYAHLDRDLSGAKTGRNGRHPLPDRATWSATAGAWGIRPGVQVVCYDDHGGVYGAGVDQ